MRRCLQLATLGAGKVAPNPMVGAVLVHNNRIIGEGYHQQYGEPHAEVNCIRSVAAKDQQNIQAATIYVSLEPCAHFGKTPPCTNLIIEQKIQRVVMGCRDSFEAVNGKGIEQLRQAGIEVQVGVLEKESRELNKRFFTYHEKKRPYIILKWARSSDGKIGAASPGRRLLISNEYSNRQVHKWRTEEAAILVGTHTALHDDPALTARLWPGKDPLRLVIDRALKLPTRLKLFDKTIPTVVFNELKQVETENLMYQLINKNENTISQILSFLYAQKIQSLIVEGGAGLLQSFIDMDIWDEARVICNEAMVIGDGLPAPVLKGGILFEEAGNGTDRVSFYKPAF